MAGPDNQGRKSLQKAFFVVIAVVIVGYLSSHLSLYPSKLATARWLQRTMPQGRPFNLPQGDNSPECLAIWNAIGANYQIYDPSKHGPYQFPWCSVGHAYGWLPFVTSVEYTWVREAQVGHGGRIWYGCLFGLTFRLGNAITRSA
jgi:hypothetical protein